MADEKFNIYKSFSNINTKLIYILIFVLTLTPILWPIGMPIAVTPDTQGFYDELTKLGPGDIVLFNWQIPFDAYMELKSGVHVANQMIIESGAKSVHVFSSPEGPAVFRKVFGDPETSEEGVITSILNANDYTEGEDYLVLGYLMINEASVGSLARRFQEFVTNDWKGNSIDGTFLDAIEDGGDFALIVDFTQGNLTDAVMRHFALDFGTPMIVGSVGVSVPQFKIYVDTGRLKAVLGSTRGGAELEFIAGVSGPGIAAMDAFSVVHYFYILILILGNIGYLGWERHHKKSDRSSIQ